MRSPLVEVMKRDSDERRLARRGRMYSDSDNRRTLMRAIVALNAPLFLLAVVQALVITQAYWTKPGHDGVLGLLWIITINVGPWGFALSLLLVAVVRVFGGASNWRTAEPPVGVFAIAVTSLVFVYVTTH